MSNSHRAKIGERLAVATVSGRSRVFVHAAVISPDLRVIVDDPSELESLHGNGKSPEGNDEIISDEELSRATLRYEKVYQNFFHVKEYLTQKRVTHYVIRRCLKVGEFSIVQYEDGGNIVLEKREKGFIERLFGTRNAGAVDGCIAVTALIIVADLLIPFRDSVTALSPYVSPRRSRTMSVSACPIRRRESEPQLSVRAQHGSRAITVRKISSERGAHTLYDINLSGDDDDVRKKIRPQSTENTYVGSYRVLERTDGDARISRERVSFSRHSSPCTTPKTKNVV
jgi:hypothetical protein